MWNSLNTIGHKAQKVAQNMSSAVAEIQKDLKEHGKSLGASDDDGYDEAEAYKKMLVGFQMDQAKLGKEIQLALREKEDEAKHWKSLYLKVEGKDADAPGTGEAGEAENTDEPDNGKGALGVDEVVKLRSQVEVLTQINEQWENKLKDAVTRSTEEAAQRMKLETESLELASQVKELEVARRASEDLIVSLSTEKTRMVNSSGEASETIDDLVDEYSRLAGEHTAQRQKDADTISRLENLRDELVEKLKAHENNILQLLQKGEESQTGVSQEMSEKDVLSQNDGDSSSKSALNGGVKTWTTEELERRLEDQAAELKADQDAAIAELKSQYESEKTTSARAAEVVAEAKRESAIASLKEEMEGKGKKALEAAAAAQEAALTAAVTAAEARLKKELDKARAEGDEASKEIDMLKAELEKKSQEAASALAAEAAKIDQLRKEMEDEIAVSRSARDEANSLYAKENRARKTIHNKLMELQGNIRVLARVRPMVEVELQSGKATDVTSFPADEDIVITKSTSRGDKEETIDTRFEFDRVFRPESSQEGVFEAVGPLVTSVLDGYNVCIFAYGQTGSGKTFTMEGPDDNPGVNTRALTNMFKIAESRSADVKYKFHMSMMEIYNEAVYDLLCSPKEREARGGGGGSSNSAAKTSLDIRQTASGGTSVPGLTEVEVTGVSEVAAQLERGGRNRAVGAHDMNEHSSRSHMIFNVRVEGTNNHTGAVVRAKLNLIDLAGSERISKTDATGDRLREAQNINRSLSALGDVISALAQGKGHVPFRNSKLTFVLQDALSGNSKVLMFVNVSPASYNVTETLCSLNFAARCRNVKLGGAQKNTESPEIAKYRRANEALQAQLVSNGIVPASAGGSGGDSSSTSPASSIGASPSKPAISSTLGARRKSSTAMSDGSKGGTPSSGRGPR